MPYDRLEDLDPLAVGRGQHPHQARVGRVLHEGPTNLPESGIDRLEVLLDDPERRARMGSAGRERVVSKLAWSHEAPKLLAAYDALLGPAD